MKLIIIAAVAQNGVIGGNNIIPWYIREDFTRFKSLTMGCPCIMGDTTYKSLPDKFRPLPGRENVVLSLDPSFYHPDITIFNDFNLALDGLKNRWPHQVDKAFVIGGATIYRLAMKFADTLELTHIHKDYQGDVIFPDINLDEWNVDNAESHNSIDINTGNEISYTFKTYHRKS